MPEHIGDVDTSLDHCEVTSIDMVDGIVTVNFAYKGHGLHHYVTVDDPADASVIVSAIEESYLRFRNDIDESINRAKLSEDIMSIVGRKYIWQ